MEENFPQKLSQYYCNKCDIDCRKKNNYEKHLLTLKHLKNKNGAQMEIENSPKKVHFFCNFCNIKTNNKKDYELHILTLKHKKREMQISCSNEQHEHTKLYICDVCDKQYTCSSGLWKHKKKCNVTANISDSDHEEETDTKNTTETKELKEMVFKLVDQNNELTKQIIELSKSSSISTNINNNSNNNNNSHNKTFNLQIFLNETCKNAMNIIDFVDQIVLNLSDLEETGRIGFAEGISKMIMKRLQKLDVTERPIHCSDLKRETLYIKNQNKWEKEEDGKPVLTNAVKQIAGKNMMQIFDWQKAHPDYNDPETRTSDKYMKMLTNVMSGGTEEEINENYEKIIKNLIKEATIDKEKFMV